MPRWRRKSCAKPVIPGCAFWRRLLRRHPGCAFWPRPLRRHSGARGARTRNPSHRDPCGPMDSGLAPLRFAPRNDEGVVICPTGKSVRSCPPPVANIYRFAFDPKHLYKPRRPVPSQRGVSWSSRNVGAAPSFVIPGRAERQPGIHPTAILAAPWFPGSRRFASRPGMTKMICPTGKSA
jgi:hypothetical protein